MIKSYNQDDYEKETDNPATSANQNTTTNSTQSPVQDDSEDSDTEQGTEQDTEQDTEQASNADSSKRRRIVLQRGYKLEGSSRTNTE